MPKLPLAVVFNQNNRKKIKTYHHEVTLMIIAQPQIKQGKIKKIVFLSGIAHMRHGIYEALHPIPGCSPCIQDIIEATKSTLTFFFLLFLFKKKQFTLQYILIMFSFLPISPRSSSPHYLVNCMCFLSLSLSNKTQTKTQNKIINKTKNALNKTNEEKTPQNPNKTWSLFVLANFLWVCRLPCDVFDILRVTPLEETSFHIPVGINCKQLLGQELPVSTSPQARVPFGLNLYKSCSYCHSLSEFNEHQLYCVKETLFHWSYPSLWLLFFCSFCSQILKDIGLMRTIRLELSAPPFSPSAYYPDVYFCVNSHLL